MLLDLPPEVLISVLQFLNIQEVHNFQLLSQFTNQLVRNHASSIYHNLAIYYGLVPQHQTLESCLNARRIYYDFLKVNPDGERGEQSTEFRVKTWKDYMQCHFKLERNWVTGICSQEIRGFDPRGPHRIQIDDVEGTVISTYAHGGVVTEDIQLQGVEEELTGSISLELWRNDAAHRWSHIEFDNGFLIWSRGSSQIEVWRRTIDQFSDPLPACNPDERQKTDHGSSVTTHPEDNTGEDKELNRGHFRPFTLLQTPTLTSASRYVHPHLVLATRNCEFAYLYDIPKARLIRSITLEEDSVDTVCYVEHSKKHVFVCTHDEVLVHRKSDGQRVFTLTKEVSISLPLEVRWKDRGENRWQDQAETGRLVLNMTATNISYYDPNFRATHISPCGRIWVVMLDTGVVLVITGFDPDEVNEPLHVTSIMTWDRDLHYLAFDGHHIALAGRGGIYTISLNRFRDPNLPLSSIHEALKHSTLLLHSQSSPALVYTSCLQVTDTAIWFVAGPTEVDIMSTISSIDFTKRPESELDDEIDSQISD